MRSLSSAAPAPERGLWGLQEPDAHQRLLEQDEDRRQRAGQAHSGKADPPSLRGEVTPVVLLASPFPRNATRATVRLSFWL